MYAQVKQSMLNHATKHRRVLYIVSRYLFARRALMSCRLGGAGKKAASRPEEYGMQSPVIPQKSKPQSQTELRKVSEMSKFAKPSESEVAEFQRECEDCSACLSDRATSEIRAQSCPWICDMCGAYVPADVKHGRSLPDAATKKWLKERTGK